MRQIRLSRAISLDLELTCYEQGKAPPDFKPEIIEIGIVEADLQSLTIVQEQSYLTKPIRTEISEYCTELTGISPEMMKAKGRPFPEVLRTLAKDFGPARKAGLVWGSDWDAIDAACDEYGVPNPFPRENFHNVGQLVSLAGGQDRRLGLYETMEIFNLTEIGTRHRGVDDARNTMRLFFVIAEVFRPVLSAALEDHDQDHAPPALLR